jgi:hypothetical protein
LACCSSRTFLATASACKAEAPWTAWRWHIPVKCMCTMRKLYKVGWNRISWNFFRRSLKSLMTQWVAHEPFVMAFIYFALNILAEYSRFVADGWSHGRCSPLSCWISC